MISGQDLLTFLHYSFLCAFKMGGLSLSPFFSKSQKRKKFIIPPKALEASSFLGEFVLFDVSIYDCMTCMIYEGYHIFLLPGQIGLFWVHGNKIMHIC